MHLISAYMYIIEKNSFQFYNVLSLYEIKNKIEIHT